MPPHIRLAIMFANAARKHGHKVLHANNIDLLTQDLGIALQEQKRIMTDPNIGTLQTVAEMVPAIAETRILLFAVTKRAGINTKGLSVPEMLNEIVNQAEARGSKCADGIRDVQKWSEDFFSNPAIHDVLTGESVKVEKPKSWKDIGKTAKQTLQKGQGEFARLHSFLKTAKEQQQQQQKPQDPKNPPQQGM